jgi:hypothetical protein
VNGQVRSNDIGNGQVKSVDILDGGITAADMGGSSVAGFHIVPGAVSSIHIADDAVGASELDGVTKLIFAECTGSSNVGVAQGNGLAFQCSVPGAALGDKVVASQNPAAQACFAITLVNIVTADSVQVIIKNVCTTAAIPGAMAFSIIVFDT